MNKALIFHLILRLLFVSFVASAPQGDDYDYSTDDTDEPDYDPCDDNICRLPNCSCFGNKPKISEVPQFVMLTFDDAITVANIDTYQAIAKKGVHMTFFVCHEYNDYSLTNKLYQAGHEIAVHSISHESNTDLWRDGTEDKWKKELVGMKAMLGQFGGIPQDELVGHRAPFLQSAGNITFRVLKKESFLYDSSMPSRNYMDPPIWPYTLDYGFSQDCQIEPCPTENFPGVWIVPMIQYQRNSKAGNFFCSMVDACTPQPETAADTKDFLMQNFLRHYHTNKAPFPVFLHEAWLKDEKRLEGYLQFLDEIMKKPDVKLVTIREVIEYMKNPVDRHDFKARTRESAKNCNNPENCSYKQPLRNMKSCVPCPKYYPWVGTPLGKRQPKDFPNFD